MLFVSIVAVDSRWIPDNALWVISFIECLYWHSPVKSLYDH